MYLKVKADCPLFSLHLANQSVSWHYLENNGGIQLVKLLWIVFFDGSEMGVHWELLTFFCLPRPIQTSQASCQAWIDTDIFVASKCSQNQLQCYAHPN